MKRFRIRYCFALMLLVATDFVIAQKTFTKSIIEEFKETPNDSLFISKYSDYNYFMSIYSFIYVADTTNTFYKDLYKAYNGAVLGPYQTDSTEFYIKVINIDSGYKARVGNIWIDKSRPEAMELATHILTEVQAGKDYNLYCRLYSDDKNKQHDCDLQWFYTDVMDQSFGEEVIKHKKGDVYIVQTTFGYHVVKSLENPIRDRQRVHFVSLIRKK